VKTKLVSNGLIGPRVNTNKLGAPIKRSRSTEIYKLKKYYLVCGYDVDMLCVNLEVAEREMKRQQSWADAPNL
jgi:hypothetical protein